MMCYYVLFIGYAVNLLKIKVSTQVKVSSLKFEVRKKYCKLISMMNKNKTGYNHKLLTVSLKPKTESFKLITDNFLLKSENFTEMTLN